MTKAKTITHVYDEENETEGMFTSEGKLLGGWALNDAHWRSEYMNSVFESLGFIMIRDDENEKLLETLRAHFN